MREKSYSVLVNVIIEKEGKILISQRGLEEDHEPGKWTIPGGTLEKTGTFFNALEEVARREALEETGVEIKDEMHLLINNTFNHDKDNLLVIAVVFLCHYKSGEARPLEDTINVKWITEEEVDNFQFPHPNVKSYILKGFEALKGEKKDVE